MMIRGITSKVTKLDAARRQLATAIRLFFEGRDMLPVVTLAAAASQVLADLLDKRGVPSPIRGGAVIVADKKPWFRRWLCKYENFFKHADNDPNSQIEFRPAFAEFMIFIAVMDYSTLSWVQRESMSPPPQLPWPLAVFFGWMVARNPGILMENEHTRPLLDAMKALPFALTTDMALECLNRDPTAN